MIMSLSCLKYKKTVKNYIKIKTRACDQENLAWKTITKIKPKIKSWIAATKRPHQDDFI